MGLIKEMDRLKNKTRLTQAEAELILRFNLLGIEMPVVDEQTLGEVVIALDDLGTVIGLGLGDGIRQLA